MDTGALVLNIGIVIISITAVAFMIRDFKIHRDQFKAEMKVGGTGIRYTVSISGKETYLFEDEGKWFVEAKQ